MLEDGICGGEPSPRETTFYRSLKAKVTCLQPKRDVYVQRTPCEFQSSPRFIALDDDDDPSWVSRFNEFVN